MKKVFVAFPLLAYSIPGLVRAQDVSNFNETVHLMVIVLCVAPFVYLLPSIIAASVRHPRSTTIFLVNLFSGWSVIGWFAALVWTIVPTRHKSVADDPRVSPAATGIEPLGTQTIESPLGIKNGCPGLDNEVGPKKKDILASPVLPFRPL